ncbi:MAG: hypothetical protein HOQ19_04800, partial [Gemmatimonadaceae bacterium]|nr:hypothetical protein [Gemmatimonadaceae bacterium]
KHPITVRYYQAYGQIALELDNEGPGMRSQRVPDALLYHDRAANAASRTP